MVIGRTSSRTSAPARLVAYWVATVGITFPLVSGGVAELLRPAYLMDGMRHLGYPDYLVTILGAWKLLGTVVLLAPGLPRLKEWAYAGAVFDLTGAAISHLAVGEPLAKIVAPLLFTGFALASWALRPPSRTLSGPVV